MSLDLDDRQRAMLAEMGVHVWAPQTVAEPPAPLAVAVKDWQTDSDRQNAIENIASNEDFTWAEEQNAMQVEAMSPAPVAAPSTQAAHVRQPAAGPRPAAAGPSPTSLLPLPPGIGQLDWPALRRTVDTCQACAMCLGRRLPVLAVPPEALRADWLVLGEPPDDAQERASVPFVGDAGVLLDNMLKAVGVRRFAPTEPPARWEAASTAYLSLVLKCRPALPTAPDAQAVAACAHYLRREIALVQPKVILAMGRLAMQVLLSEDHPQGLKLPLGKLRGQVWHYQGVPVVVTYPPVYLLRNSQDKARAWEDLCLAMEVVQGGTAAA
ncbi:uracil-DNA glycosylase [Rhodoferax sp.]|uniref:uracil-DNA glycosylase n=1 Tax=Rhodoferax sp. TaxID=50421 RepID=UPI00260BC874|nr:uracil-DNA glycosylase [Rhodoferax sp.]MDD2925292.1 uracil-DNA glycosylase [Rhodoferax sp.]